MATNPYAAPDVTAPAPRRSSRERWGAIGCLAAGLALIAAQIVWRYGSAYGLIAAPFLTAWGAWHFALPASVRQLVDAPRWWKLGYVATAAALFGFEMIFFQDARLGG